MSRPGETLRQLAENATPGPWAPYGTLGWFVRAQSPRGTIARISGGASVEADKADARLIALAPALAVWAADAAAALADTQRFCGGCIDADDLLARLRAVEDSAR